ncbi:MAG: 5-formyltetrahydrofolate cyclo-ligase [Elusimicrobiota bacterium]
MRKKHKQRRIKIDPEKRHMADSIIYKKLKSHPCITGNRNIMLYVSVNGEVDTSRIIDCLLSAGKRVYLPVISETDLLPVEIDTGTQLHPGRFGIPEPDPEKRLFADPELLDVVIIPGVSFTKKGTRLGRGGGYYDRFIDKLRAGTHLIGLCYNCQLENHIPNGLNDKHVHEVITEEGMNRSNISVSGPKKQKGGK